MKLTQKQIEAQIRRNNRLFKGKTKARQRVLIAMDVLERLKTGQFQAQSGTWFDGAVCDRPDHEKIQTLLLAGVECTGCALGGLMMSCTVFNNQERVEHIGEDRWSGIASAIENGDAFPNGLLRIFGEKQLALIEAAFEQGGNIHVDLDEDEMDSARMFGCEFDSDEERLVAIMTNIVKNKGRFVP